MRKYQARILRLCASLLADQTLAEDAAQEIFFKAYRSLPAFRGDAAFSTWLYHIAANHCRDLLRRRARERTESWDALLERDGERLEQRVASPDPKAAVAAADAIEHILSRLSPDERVLITLREVEGLNYREIAGTLGCSVGAVKIRLFRARQALQRQRGNFAPPAASNE